MDIMKYRDMSISEILLDHYHFLPNPGDKELFSSFLSKSIGNNELSKALAIICNYGKPPQEFFAYKVPTYNTQLQMLVSLLNYKTDEIHEIPPRIAAAAAIIYGSIYTIGNERVQESLIPYIIDTIAYHTMTENVLDYHHITNTPMEEKTIEELITILWGAPGNYIAVKESLARDRNWEFNPNDFQGIWKGYSSYFKDDRMEMNHFSWLFTDLATMKEMRDYILNSNIIADDIHTFSDNLFKFWYFEKLNYQWQLEIIDVEGWDIASAYICNIDFQWEHFKRYGLFIGTSGDGYIDFFFKKSINIAALTPTYLMHMTGYYDHENGNWRTSNASRLDDVEDTLDNWLGWNKVPWDNFWNNYETDGFDDGFYSIGRSYFMKPNDAEVWHKGIPGGYIYRQINPAQ